MRLRPAAVSSILRLLRPFAPLLVLAAVHSLPATRAAAGEGEAPASPTPSAADRNWAQWRGPTTAGVSLTAQPPVRWSETSNVRWKVKIPGRGTSTPIVWDDVIFLQTAIASGPKDAAPAKPGEGGSQAGGKTGSRSEEGASGRPRVEAPTDTHQFVLLALDRKTGKELWRKVLREEVPHEGHHKDHGFASSSPATDGKHVFAYFGSRGLHCLGLDGSVKWQKDLGRMQTRNSFGEGSSPVLHGSSIVINWDHQGDDFIAAFDKETGRELWRKSRDEDTTWSTPLIVQRSDATEVVTAASRRVRSYDLATGEQLWECGGLTSNVIPSPVALRDLVFVTSGYRGSALLAVRLGRKGDLTGTEAVAWSVSKSTPYVPSPLLYGDRLYFCASNNAIISCHDAATGRAHVAAQRLEGLEGVYASPVGAAGRVYIVGRNGATVVVRHPAAGDKAEVLATNLLDERIDASPALSEKDLFLRGHEHLYCLAEM